MMFQQLTKNRSNSVEISYAAFSFFLFSLTLGAVEIQNGDHDDLSVCSALDRFTILDRLFLCNLFGLT